MHRCRRGCGTVILYYRKRGAFGSTYLLDSVTEMVKLLIQARGTFPSDKEITGRRKEQKNPLKLLKLSMFLTISH